MPSYTYRVRKPEPATEVIVEHKVVIDRKLTRPSTAKLTAVSRPSAAKAVERVPRPPRESSDE